MNKKIYIDFTPDHNTSVYCYDKQNHVPVKDSTGVNSKKFFIVNGGTAKIETDNNIIFIDAWGDISIRAKTGITE